MVLDIRQIVAGLLSRSKMLRDNAQKLLDRAAKLEASAQELARQKDGAPKKNGGDSAPPGPSKDS